MFVKEKTESTNKLLVHVGSETEIVNEQRAVAKVENEKAAVEREIATKTQAECDVELAKVTLEGPPLFAAQLSLNMRADMAELL